MIKSAVATGAWLIFGGLSAADAGVLSVMASTVSAVLYALREGKRSLTLDTLSIPVDRHTALLGTLHVCNASQIVRLPDALRIVTRTCFAQPVERAVVIEIILTAVGFRRGRLIARKIDAILNCFGDQTPSLRQFCSSMAVPMAVVRKCADRDSEVASLAGGEEEFVMLRLRELMLPAMAPDDASRFSSLLEETFRIRLSPSFTPPSEELIADELRRTDLCASRSTVIKFAHLHDALTTSHVVAVVGPPCSGKSTAIDLVTTIFAGSKSGVATSPKRPRTQAGVSESVKAPRMLLTRFFPSTLTQEQIFGKASASGEWADGLVGALLRRGDAASSKSPLSNFVIFDGPFPGALVDFFLPLLSSDALTSPLGERGRSPLRILFESNTLADLSPAATARLHVVALSERTVGWRGIIDAWLSRNTDIDFVRAFIVKVVDDAMHFVSVEATPILSVSTGALARYFLALLEASIAASAEVESGLTESLLQRLVVFVACWTIAGALGDEDRKRFCKLIMTNNNADALPDIGPSDSLHDFFLGDETREWERWDNVVHPSSFATSTNHFIVRSAELTRAHGLLDAFLAANIPPLLSGPPGVGKSAAFTAYSILQRDRISLTLPSDASHTAATLQAVMDSILERRSSSVYGPLGNRRALIFVEDLNALPAGSANNCPVELLRQAVGEKSLYHLERVGELKQLVDINFVAAITTSRKTTLAPRLQSLLAPIVCGNPSDPSLTTILSKFVHTVIASKELPPASNTISALVLASVSLHAMIRDSTTLSPFRLRPTTLHSIWILTHTLLLGDHALTRPLSDSSVSMWAEAARRCYSDELQQDRDRLFIDDAVSRVVVSVLSFPSQPPSLWFVNSKITIAQKSQPDGTQDGALVYPNGHSFEAVRSLEDLRGKLCDAMETIRKYNRHVPLLLAPFSVSTSSLILSAHASIALADPSASPIVYLAPAHDPVETVAYATAYAAGLKPFIFANADPIDVVSVAIRAGVSSSPCAVILFGHAISDHNLRVLSTLSTSGELGGLVAPEDIEAMLADIQAVAATTRRGIGVTKSEAKAMLSKRLRGNVHAVIVMRSDVDFASIALRFPLFHRATIRIVDSWGVEAYEEVASHTLSALGAKLESDGVSKQQVAALLASVAVTSRSVMDKQGRLLSVAHFVNFVSQFVLLYKVRADKLSALLERVGKAQQRLEGAEDAINSASQLVENGTVALSKTSKESADMLREILRCTIVAERKRHEVTEQRKLMGDLQTELDTKKKDIDEALAGTVPWIEEAENSVKSLSGKDLSTLRSMKKPPLVIKFVFDAMLLLLQRPVVRFEMSFDGGRKTFKDSYVFAMSMMMENTFLRTLMDFNKDGVNAETIELLAPYTDSKDFTLENAVRASRIAGSLFIWSRNVLAYHDVAKGIQPRLAELKNIQKNLFKCVLTLPSSNCRRMNTKLGVVTVDYTKAQSELDRLSTSYERLTALKKSLAHESDNLQRRLNASHALVASLPMEKTNWQRVAEVCDEHLAAVLADSASVAAFLCFGGSLPLPQRNRLVGGVQRDASVASLRSSQELDALSFLVEEAELQGWQIDGTLRDRAALETVGIAFRSAMVPFVVDPARVFVSWVRRNPDIAFLFDSAKMRDEEALKLALDEAISNGRTIVVEDPAPSILRAVVDLQLLRIERRSDSATVVDVGRRKVNLPPRVSLILTAASPSVLDDAAFARCVNRIDMALTPDGVDFAFLHVAADIERRELLKDLSDARRDVCALSRRVKEFGDALLRVLSMSAPNFLEDMARVEDLAVTKKREEEAKRQLVGAHARVARLELAAYDDLRPLIANASRSFEFFKALHAAAARGVGAGWVIPRPSLSEFTATVANAWLAAGPPSSAALSKRGEVIKRALLVGTGHLFALHLPTHLRFLAAFLAALRVACAPALTENEALSYFVNANTTTAFAAQDLPKKPINKWLPQPVQIAALALSKSHKGLEKLFDSLAGNETAWRRLLDAEAPERLPLPDVESSVSRFEKLLVMRLLREDRMYPSVQLFVSDILSPDLVSALRAPIDFSQVAAVVPALVPVVYVTQRSSADLRDRITNAFSGRKPAVDVVSLLPAAADLALATISTAQVNGSWVIALDADANPSLLRRLLNVAFPERIDPAHRLIICSKGGCVSSDMLDTSCVIFDDPDSYTFAADVLASAACVSVDAIDELPNKEWRTLALSAVVMNAVLTGRARFGRFGSIGASGVEAQDATMAVRVIQRSADRTGTKKVKDLDVKSFHSALGSFVYWPRFTNRFDQKIVPLLASRYAVPSATAAELLAGAKASAGLSSLAALRDVVNSLPHAERHERLGLNANCDAERRSDLNLTLVSDLFKLSLILDDPSATPPHVDDEPGVQLGPVQEALKAFAELTELVCFCLSSLTAQEGLCRARRV